MANGQTGVDAHDSAGVASNAGKLEAAGDTFAAQYVGIDPATEDGGSSVTSAQVAQEQAAGLSNVSIFETNSMSSTNYQTGAANYAWETYLTQAQGMQDAAAAYQAAEAIGQPSGSAIYFAMDFDPAATDGRINEATALSDINAYFSGVDQTLSAASGPTYKVGVYGAGDTLQSVSNGGLASYTWLSLSSGWAGYGIDASAGPTHGWTMIQSAGNAAQGVATDADTTDTGDFGAFATQTAACYAAGTRLLTDRGEVAIEALRVGDNVVALHHGGLRRVRWLGHRRLDLRGHPRPWEVEPIRVAAGAFDEGRPHRDLWLSPGHAVFVDGVLIPVERLVNGATIAQVRRDDITYWHVELDHHEIVLAEGLGAESYLDTGNRRAFDNGGVCVTLHPDFRVKDWAETCVPLVQSGPRLAQVKARLLRRAFDAFGHRLTSEPRLHLQADGRAIEAEVAGGTYRFALPAGASAIRLMSRTWVPRQVLAESDDPRPLGVQVRHLLFDGCDRLAATDDGDGWYGLEHDPAGSWRWTDGAAALPTAAATLEIELLGSGLYWDNEGEAAVMSRTGAAGFASR